MNGFMFPASGSSSGSDERKFKEYGGILYRYNNNHVQVYAPGVSSNHISHLYGSTRTMIAMLGPDLAYGLFRVGLIVSCVFEMLIIPWMVLALHGYRYTSHLNLVGMKENAPPETRCCNVAVELIINAGPNCIVCVNCSTV